MDALRTILTVSIHRLFVTKYRKKKHFNSLYRNSLTIDERRKMKRNSGMQINFDGVPVDSCNIVTKQVGSSSEARRRRKLVMEKDRGFVKRKRTAVYRGDEFVPPPLPPNVWYLVL